MPDVKKLLEKSKLTGWELGRLLLMDNVEHDHGRPVILDKEDVRALKRRLDQFNPKEARDFHRLQHLYRVVGITNYEGRIEGLEVLDTLNAASDLLKRFHTEDSIRRVMIFMLPAIVTKKQHEELKAKERDYKLSRSLTLLDVLDELAPGLAPAEIIEEGMAMDGEGAGYGYITDFLAESPKAEYRAILGDITRQLIQLIRDGRLHPVALSEKAGKKIRELDKEHTRLMEEDAPLRAEYLMANHKKRVKVMDEGLRDGRESMTKERIVGIITLLARVAGGSVHPGDDEARKILESTFCPGEEVYRAGVKGFVEEVDREPTNIEIGEAARADGPVQSLAGVAILQEPSELVDGRGYFNDAASRTLGEISEWASFAKWTKERGNSLPEMVERLHKLSCMRIKKFLSIKMILEAVSAAVGVGFTEDLDQMEERIQRGIKAYNNLTQPLESKGEGIPLRPPHYLGIPKLKALKIGKLKPTASSIQYYKERMAFSLGDGWYEEAIKTVEFDAEAGSLAEEVAAEIKAHNALEEADHGQK